MKCHKPPKVPEGAAEVAAGVGARAQRDNTHTANTGNSEPGQHGRIASATVQPHGATVPRQQVSRTHGASRPGDTIRNGNNGGARRNRHNGRNVDADVILTGGGLLPGRRIASRRCVYDPPIIPRRPGTVGKHLPAPPPSLLIYIISIYKI